MSVSLLRLTALALALGASAVAGPPQLAGANSARLVHEAAAVDPARSQVATYTRVVWSG